MKNIVIKNGKEMDMLNLGRDISWKRESAKEHKKLAESVKKTKKRKECPVCREKKKEKIMNVYGFDFLECGNCGHVYMEDIPLDYFEEYYSQAITSDVYLGDDIFKKRVENIVNPKLDWMLKNIPSIKKWMDIGCGTGEVVYGLQEKGYDALGVDSNKDYISFGLGKGINLIEDYLTLDNISSYLKGVNVISLFNLLEHMEDPKDILGLIGNNMDKDSYIVIEVPRYPSISAINNYIHNDTVSRYIYPPEHLHIFTEKSIEILLNENGIDSVCIWRFGQDLYDFILTSMANKGEASMDIRVVNNILPKLNAIQKSIDEQGLSDTMIIIGRKVN